MIIGYGGSGLYIDFGRVQGFWEGASEQDPEGRVM